MKKNILIILIVIFALTISSCAGSAEGINEQRTDRVEIISSEEASLTINVPIIYKSATQWQFELFRDKYDDLDRWYELIKDEFNLDIEINYIPALYAFNIANSEYYIEKINNNELSGLILVENGNFNNIPDLRDNGLIYPLDDFLENNYNFSLMPEEMKNAYRLPDGKIWALPAGYNNSLYGRRYNKEWLEKLDLDVPDSLESLYETAKAFAYKDPNNNGLSDEKGIAGEKWEGPQIFGDIFLANECYLSNFFQSTLAFDYTTGAYEDAILKPEMTDTLAYIKSMLNEKIARIMQNYGFRTNGTSGSFYSAFSEIPSEEIWTMGYSIIPDKPHSAMGKGPERCFVLTSNTIDAEQTINAFINGFYTDNDSILKGMYGIPSTNYEISNRNLSLKSGPYIGLLSDMPHISMNYIDTIEEESGYVHGNKANFYDKYTALYNTDILTVDTDDYLPNIDGSDVRWAFGGYFTWYFLDVFESMGTEDFMSYYSAEMKKAGIQEIMDKLNEEAGTVATYRYN